VPGIQLTHRPLPRIIRIEFHIQIPDPRFKFVFIVIHEIDARFGAIQIHNFIVITEIGNGGVIGLIALIGGKLRFAFNACADIRCHRGAERYDQRHPGGGNFCHHAAAFYDYDPR